MCRPRLFGRLESAARVTVVSAPPGSGKTVLLRSWIGAAGLAERAAWVPAGRAGRDPQRLWLAVVVALRGTAPGSTLVRELTAAPDLDGWAVVERLLADLAPLQDRLWLVIDDVHELGPDPARRQLELLLMRAPPQLRFVLATRHDVRLGLHRLRLEGKLAGRTPAAPPATGQPPLEPVTDSEIRVLRYLPTNLTAPEIARELYVSHNTVKAHMRNLYAKLGTHRRGETVTRARALGLLAPAPLTGQVKLAG